MMISDFPYNRQRRLFLCCASTTSALLAHGAPVTAATASSIKLRDLYHRDMSFSELAESLANQTVTVQGYMAPPLKSQSRFFVLTKRPMSTCPFCNDGDEWPDDLVAVYTKRVVDVQPFNVDLAVTGTLVLGDYRDPDTGFFSRVRLINARYQRA